MMLDADEADELDVPMAWFQAEQLASKLILPVKDPSQPSVFGRDAAQAVLALTVLLSGMSDQPGELSNDQLALIKELLTPGARWLEWCNSMLNAGNIPASSLQFAQQAFRWLLLGSPIPNGKAAQSPGAVACAGLRHVRLALTWALA
jgi:hypothetical protein